MAIKDDDLLYVQRPSGPDAGEYKLTAGNLKTDLNDEYLSKKENDTAAGEITFNVGLVSKGEIQVKNDGVGADFPGVGNNNAGVVIQPKGGAGLSAVYGDATSTVLNLNRGNFNGSLITFRKNGGIQGGISIYDDHWESSGESHHIDDIKIGGTWGVDEKIELSKLGTARFAGITEHEGGVKVTGGGDGSVTNRDVFECI